MKITVDPTIEASPGLFSAGFTAIVLVAHLIVFFLPMHFHDLVDAAHISLFFLISLPLGGLASIWPGMNGRKLWMTLPFILVSESLIILGMPALEFDFVPRYYWFRHGWIDLSYSVGLHVFLCTVVSVGFVLRRLDARFALRRFARDREEIENLYEIWEKAGYAQDLSLFRFETMIQQGYGFVAEQDRKWRAVVSTIHVNAIAMLYCFVPLDNEWDEFVWRNLLQRPELEPGVASHVVYIMQEPEPATEALLAGMHFRLIDATDTDINVALRRLQAVAPLPKLPDWRPFESFSRVLVRDSTRLL